MASAPPAADLASGADAMSPSLIELVPVEDAPTREAARSLIAEYLNWIAGCAATKYGLSFDVDAMVASDLDDDAEEPRLRRLAGHAE